MKTLFLFFISFTSISIFSQEADESIKTKFQVGLNISPDIAYRFLYNRDNLTNSDINIENRNDEEKIKLGYTIGINTKYRLNNFLKIGFGIQYENRGYKTNPFKFYENPRQGEPLIEKTIWFIYHFHYINLPVQIDFYTNKDKLSGLVSIGVAPGYLLKGNRFSYELANNEKNKYNNDFTDFYEKFSIAPFIEMGLEYQLNNNFSILCAPTLRLNFLKVYDDYNGISDHLWNAGLQLGCFYNL